MYGPLMIVVVFLLTNLLTRFCTSMLAKCMAVRVQLEYYIVSDTTY